MACHMSGMPSHAGDEPDGWMLRRHGRSQNARIDVQADCLNRAHPRMRYRFSGSAFKAKLELKPPAGLKVAGSMACSCSTCAVSFHCLSEITPMPYCLV